MRPKGAEGRGGEMTGKAVTAVKFCGITRLEDALEAAALGADALGFVFHRPSPRYIEPSRAAGIAAEVRRRFGDEARPFPGPAGRGRRPALVGVFVDEDPEVILAVASRCGLDLFQLHGDEGPEDCRRLSGERVVKAFSPRDRGDLERIDLYPVRAVLVDARDGDRRGGTGRTADWDLARAVAGKRPLILAGGISPRNVAAALSAVAPAAVDVNSGVEEAPGVKDREKMAALLAAVRAWEGEGR